MRTADFVLWEVESHCRSPGSGKSHDLNILKDQFLYGNGLRRARVEAEE